MLSALLIAMLTAITVWWLLIQRLKDKPWLKQGVVPTSRSVSRCERTPRRPAPTPTASLRDPVFRSNNLTRAYPRAPRCIV
jgi:hypothetical protein